MNKALKRLLCVLVTVSVLCGTLPVFAAVLPADGLLMSITFDEKGTGTGSFEASLGGTVTEHGSVAYTDNYDGSSKALSISTDNADNYLELPKGILAGSEAATAAFWIKPGTRWAFFTTPVSGEQTYEYEKYLGLLASPSSLQAERFNNDGTRLSTVTSNGTYMDWQYVAVTYAANGTSVYVNGRLVSSDTAAVDVKSLFTDDALAWIGHANWGTGEGFSGMMDDFLLYGRALSEDEIQALSAAAVERETQNTIAKENRLVIDTQFYTASDLGFTWEENKENGTITAKVNNNGGASVIAAAYSDGVLKKAVHAKLDSGSGTLKSPRSSDSDIVKVFVYDAADELRQSEIKKTFQYSGGENILLRAKITNYLPDERTVSVSVIPCGADGSEGEAMTAAEDFTISPAESESIERLLQTDASVSCYRVVVTDKTSGKSYDGGYLPKANVSFPEASPPDTDATTFGAHDPTVFKDPVSGKYYAYSSHNLVYESSDLIHWKEYDYTSSYSDADPSAPSEAQPSASNNTGIAITIPQTAYDFIKNNYPDTQPNGTYWAPDILYKAGDEYPYWFYLSISCGLGGRNSVINLIKAKSPLLWGGETQDCGVVLASVESKDYNTNAIDANIFTDTDGKTYLIWGSFWKGIHMAELDASTGKLADVDYTSDEKILESCKSFGARMYSTPAGVVGPEGPFTVYNADNGYRYMFTSYGWLGTNYNIRVARTDKTFAEILAGSSHRFLQDQQGRLVGTTYADQVKEGGTLDELWGYKMSGSFRLGDGIEYVGSGHNSVLRDDDGSWYLVQHCRKIADAAAYLQVKKMLWTKDGWPVISPLVYAGEKEQQIPKEMLYGTWDLSSVGHTILDEGVTDVSKSGAYKGSDLPVHSSEMILQKDGVIGGGDAGTLGKWTYDGDHTVTLTFDTDGDADNYEFYKNGDVMTLFVLTGYDKDRRESAIVMTGTDQNSVASFAKKSSAVSQSTRNVNRVQTTATTVKKSVGGNPILGFGADGDTLYAGDPAAFTDGDTVYIIAGHDTSTSEGYVMPEWVAYSSKDMKEWKYEGAAMDESSISWVNDNVSAWASQAVKYNGKYYLYYCAETNHDIYGGKSIGVAVADSPTGPYTDIGEPLVTGSFTPDSSTWNDIDPTVWVEKVNNDEHRYLCWGNSKLFICELNEDMVSVKDIDGNGKIEMGTDIVEQTITDAPDVFTEAPWIYRQKDKSGRYTGKYYLFYAMGWREQMAYATADNLVNADGTLNTEWTYGGTLMPPTATSNTNHPSVIDFKNKTYFIYHNGSLPWGSGFRRSVCAAELTINKDGTIDPITETSTGLTGTASTITCGGKSVYHESFINPSDDSSYPLKRSMYAGEASDASDAEWEIENGKYDARNENYVSIQAVNKPGLYICASGRSVILTQQDTLDESLAKRMTFKTVKGIGGTRGAVSFESAAKPGFFLTVDGAKLTLTDGTDAKNCDFILK